MVNQEKKRKLHIVLLLFLVGLCIIAAAFIIRAIFITENKKSEYHVIETLEFGQETSGDFEFEENGEINMYQRKVSLMKGDAFLVEFDISGQDEDGGVIAVDLYTKGYDNPESEIRMSVSEQSYRIRRLISFGDVHPINCCLRIFTLGDTKATVSNLSIERVRRVSNKDTMAGIIGLLSVSLLLTFVPLFKSKGRKEYFVLAGIIGFQVLLMVFWSTQKTDFYVDELYSLGEAQRFTGVGNSALYLYDNWDNAIVTAGQLKQRLILGNGESLFDKPILFAIERLLAGKNYFGLLNISESVLGKDIISAIPGIVLNIILFAATEVMLFALLKSLRVSENGSLLGVWWYGFCGMTIGNVVFVRFYTLSLFLFIIVLLVHAFMWKTEDTRTWVISEIATFLCMYLLCKNTKLGVPMIASIASCFFLGLFFARRWRKVALYGIPMVGGGALIVVKLYFIDIMKNTKEYIESANAYNGVGDIDRVEGVVATVDSFTIQDMIKKAVQSIESVMTRVTGNMVFFGILVILLIGILVYAIVKKTRQSQTNEIRGYPIVLLGATVAYLMVLLVAMDVVIRYYSPVCVLFIVVTIYLIDCHSKKQVVALLASFTIFFGCLYTNMKGNIDYLYRDDISFHDSLADYDKTDSFVVMDTPSFQRPLYEAVVWMEDDAAIGQIFLKDDEILPGDTVRKSTVFPDEMLLWSFPDQDISGYLRWLDNNKYTYRILGTGSAAQVYVCQKSNN